MITTKKGSVIDIVIWMVLAFTITIFFAGWMWGFGQITDTLTGIVQTEAQVEVVGNISQIAENTFGQVDSALVWLRIISFAIIISMSLSIFISNFFIKEHPLVLVIYILVNIMAVIVSAFISNEYEKLLTNAILGPELQAFTMTNFIMAFLPLVTTIIGIFGALFLVVGFTRDRSLGGAGL